MRVRIREREDFISGLLFAAIGLGAVFLHLHAHVNWHRLFMQLIEGFDLGALERRQKAALKAAGLGEEGRL